MDASVKTLGLHFNAIRTIDFYLQDSYNIFVGSPMASSRVAIQLVA